MISLLVGQHKSNIAGRACALAEDALFSIIKKKQKKL